jgi:alpha-glucosidase
MVASRAAASGGPWWREAVVYQIYPRSWADSDGDGVGDLSGMLPRLDHLGGVWESLGIDAIWLSPFYASPMVDFGYDVSDHCAVDPAFGTLEDFDALLTAAHARGIRVLVDYVPNHTSDQHPWFREARSNRSSPRRDWYLWADPAPGGGPPNNWLSTFAATGPAWTLDSSSGQYYLHSYSPAQPDLNWQNPQVRAAMIGVLRFWLDRGVDGVRVDAAHRLGKDSQLRDNPAVLAGRRTDLDPNVRERFRHIDHAPVHEILRELRQILDAYDGRVAVGEVGIADLTRMGCYYGNGDELHLVFCFAVWQQPFSAVAYRSTVAAIEAALPRHAWPAYALSNHDLSRATSRLSGPGDSVARARVAATVLLTLRGTPFLYYGEEIGMTDGPVPPGRARDPDGRDGCRTPMQWNGNPGAGFTTGDPWLPIPATAATVNVADQLTDRSSLLTFYRELIRLRRDTAVLRAGDYQACAADPYVYAYHRHDATDDVLIAANFSESNRRYADPRLTAGGDRLLSTAVPGGGEVELRPLHLRPLEATVIRPATG